MPAGNHERELVILERNTVQHVQQSYLLQLGTTCTSLSNTWSVYGRHQYTHHVHTAYNTPSLSEICSKQGREGSAFDISCIKTKKVTLDISCIEPH